jgi:hypothetical protein
MNKTEHLLTCLIEECAEVQKEAAKALRFGLSDHAPDTPDKANADAIAAECVDLAAIIEMLEEEDIIPALKTPEGMRRKKEKVIKYMKYAANRGSLKTL